MHETFLWKLSSLIKVRACYKNPGKFLCIDLLLTNEPKSFQSSSVGEMGLSDFHKMAVTLMKTTLEKLKPKVTYFSKWSELANQKFKTQLLIKSRKFKYYITYLD